MRLLYSLVSIILILSYSCGNQHDIKDKFNYSSWSVTGGDDGISHYSTLTKIDTCNVSNLKIAWKFNSGSIVHNQCNPIVVEGIMYFTTGFQELIALDAKSGKEKWRYKPNFERNERPEFMHINRGLAFWTDGKTSRVYFSSGNFINSIDAITGKLDLDFGRNGQIDLNQNQHKAPDQIGLISSGSPVIFNDLVIVGCSSWAAAANVSAYDVRTGKRVWKFNTIPHYGEWGHYSYGDPDFWMNGAGVNVWGGLSLDKENGMIFFGTGQPKQDFYRPFNQGDHLFANCVVALNAFTGKRIWHYQVIHHDLWDLDVPCAPVLADLKIRGKVVPAAIQVTKTGNTFIFNRLTGALLSDIEERRVKQSELFGEMSSITQPFVLWPESFSKQELTTEDATILSQEKHECSLAELKRSDLKRFDPPSEKGMIYYGLHGGANWGGPAIDPVNSMMYINTNEIAWHIEMIDVNKDDPIKKTMHPGEKIYLMRNCAACHGVEGKGMDNQPTIEQLEEKYNSAQMKELLVKGRGSMPANPNIGDVELDALTDFLLKIEGKYYEGLPVETKPNYVVKGYNRFLDKDGYPAIKPPWGTLTALNLITGKVNWKIPLGEYPELTAQGIPVTGSENFGGPLVTKGGVIFITATRDEKFRAFHAKTGKLLWETHLPFGGYATPSTYEIDGKQYVVILTTGGGKLGTTEGDALIAFSLN